MKEYFKKDEDKDFNIKAMQVYMKEKIELDEKLFELIKPEISGKHLKILDACCGIGHISKRLSQMSPESEIIGVDKTQYLLDEADKKCISTNITYINDDIFSYCFSHKKEFDITVCWKTLLAMEYYEYIMSFLLGSTKKKLYISSIFYDGWIDFQTKIREYKKEAGKEEFNVYYNTYSIPKFVKFCLENGAKEVKMHELKFYKKIPRANKDIMGTYTHELKDGTMFQISGAVPMSWYIAEITML